MVQNYISKALLLASLGIAGCATTKGSTTDELLCRLERGYRCIGVSRIAEQSQNERLELTLESLEDYESKCGSSEYASQTILTKDGKMMAVTFPAGEEIDQENIDRFCY